jgi:hypothetical protein
MFSKKYEENVEGAIAEEVDQSVAERELEGIINKFKKIEGEWSIKDIEAFTEELTSKDRLKEETTFTDGINNAALASLRDGSIPSGTLQ